jgi:uncharacterized protein YodC (DUF2158 family)
MRRLFRKGQLVRSKVDGKVMEVLKYLKANVVEVKWFDLDSKEIRINRLKENQLNKAA